jgi:hypothetical protein
MYLNGLIYNSLQNYKKDIIKTYGRYQRTIRAPHCSR